MDNPVVIAGSLSKEELEKSINEIVDAVDDGLNRVSEKFDTQLAAIEETFKQAGTKIGTAFKDSFNAAFGGSFDQLAAAMEKMSKASPKGASSANASGVTGGGSKNQNITYPNDSIGELRQQIKELQIKLNYEKRNTDELQKQVDLLHQAKAELKSQTTTRSLSSALAMPDISATQIAEKMKALRSVQAQNADEAKRVGNEYQRLSQRQKELLGNTNSLTNGNNALARSFGYIRNRLVYALTIGSVMSFVKQMYSVRAEYELLERSMGVLIDNFRKGSEIFNELNAMALKSPFTLVELGTAAKQLLAYNFAEDEVIDTTRRLADISAALGVPMERLVYNLGQIRAQTVLTARDARDFANAGLAIVPMLAKMYTEQKKFGDEIVTTAQVYDMMKKKLVSYEDVMKVINQVTDEGGKFFDFQAKQAETLKVQLANLTLAWNNMLNDIASGNQTALNTPIRSLKSLFQNWRSVLQVVQALIVAYGAYKAKALLIAAVHKILALDRLTAELWRSWNAMGALMQAFTMIKAGAVAARLAIGGLIPIIAGVASYFLIFKNNVSESVEDLKMFGEAGIKVVRNVENLYATLSSISKESGNYKKVMGELNSILEDYGLETIKETSNLETLNESRRKNIELLKLETLERQYLNQVENERAKYNKEEEEQKRSIENTIASFGGNWKKYAPAIANIISEILNENIDAIAGKTGKETAKAAETILEKVKQGLKENPMLEDLEESGFKKIGTIRGSVIWTNIAALKQTKEAVNDNIAALEAENQKNEDKIKSLTTLNDKIEKSSRLLMNASTDTDKFYRKIDQLVKQYSGQNIVEFLVDVKAQVPQWMLKMGIEDLSKFASNFTAIAQEVSSAGYKSKNVNGTVMTVDKIWEKAALYAEAVKQKQAELNKEQDKPKGGGSKKDELGDALTKELQLINDIQKLYKEYTKAGIGMDEAKIAAAKEYQNTLQQTNNTLSKFGVQGLTGEELATMDLRQMRDYYQSIIDKVQSSPKAVEALEKAIRNLNVELTKEGQKTIIDSLNNELSKLKDEYELGIELDANPELSGAFAEAFGLDLSGLPTTIEEVVRRAQKTIDEKLGGSGLFNILTGDIESLRQTLGQSIDSGLIDAVEKAQKSVRDLWKKDAQETISGWDKLLEKYAEYEYKRKKIMEDAEKERRVARKRGADGGVMGAIDAREVKELAKLEFEEFQKTPEWITATGDLAGLTDSALGLLINRIEQFKKSQKGLDAKQIKQLNNALKQLYQQQRKGNPFLQLSNAIMENRQRREEWVKELEEAGNELEEQNKKIADGAHLTEEETEKRLKLIDRIKELKEAIKNLADATPEQVVDYLKTIYDVAGQATGAVTDMLNAFGNTEITNKISKVMSMLEKGFQFAQIGAAIGGKSGGGWGAAIGGILGLLAGGITAWADEISGNASITKRIESSERAVKRLQNAYIDLEQAVENSYGTEEYYLQKLANANKRAQLEQLKRQLYLEQSRSQKKQDQDKILELQGQIKELEYEISNNLRDIVNDFMGISSVGDAIEDMVGNIINALRSGENAMSSFDKSIDDMIANMVKKLYSEKILGDWFEDVWGKVEQDVAGRTSVYERDLGHLESWWERLQQELADQNAQAYTNAQLALWLDKDWWSRYGTPSGATNLREYYERVKAYLEEAIQYGSKYTLGDIQQYAELLRSGKPILEGQLQELDDTLRTLGLMNGSTTDKLSNLQQGIQGITEDTAGALEAYMNGVSQQVYLHSTLLTEIRDAVVGFNMDVQLGVQSQILLELQNSYQVQMAIQGILQGWSSANGLAVRVEMV